MRIAAAAVTLLIALSLAACSGTTSGANGNSTTTTTTITSSGNGQPSNTTGSSGLPGCPKASVVSAAMGSTFTGPTFFSGGPTCIYSASGIEVHVLYLVPSTSESGFAKQAQSDMGNTAASVSGVGSEAFESTANGQAEIEVWKSSSVNFSITINPTNSVVKPQYAGHAEALAKALVAL
jgi:hypothetical protein